MKALKRNNSFEAWPRWPNKQKHAYHISHQGN